MIHLENALKISLQDVLKMSWRRFCRTSWRRFEDTLKTFENVLRTSCQDAFKMLWRSLEDIFETSWRRLEVVFWRPMTKTNIFALIKTSWRRLRHLKTKTKEVFKTSLRRFHQDECLLRSLKKFLFAFSVKKLLWFFCCCCSFVRNKIFPWGPVSNVCFLL